MVEGASVSSRTPTGGLNLDDLSSQVSQNLGTQHTSVFSQVKDSMGAEHSLNSLLSHDYILTSDIINVPSFAQRR